MKKLVNLILGTISLTSVNLAPAFAQATAVPMRLQQAEGTYTLTVPETDTTKSAYGGRLRLYDVHIAKMFEITYFDCDALRGRAGGRSWYYYAGNGSINMGQFNISCRLAFDIASAYGFTKPETTVIEYSQEEAGVPITRTLSIPVLDITGNKIDRWLNFVANFRPVK